MWLALRVLLCLFAFCYGEVFFACTKYGGGIAAVF
jgi:hypothetical protein